MSAEGKGWSEKPQRVNLGYARQDDMFHLIPDTREQPTGIYTRSRIDFWKEDILPVTIKMRDIYPVQQHDFEVGMLQACWDWLHTDGNMASMSDASLSTLQKLVHVPTYVLLNNVTVQFWALQETFSEPSHDAVMYEPGSNNWRRDIHNNVTDFVFRIKMKQSYEVEHMDHAIGTIEDVIAQRAEQTGLEYSLVERADRVDTISWMLLMNYHLELTRRERASR